MKALSLILAYFPPLLLCLLSDYTVRAQGAVNTLFLTRQPAPGTDADINYSSFDTPRVGGMEQIAFLATVEGIGVGPANDQAIWNRSNGVTSVVEREGFVASGTAGALTNDGFAPTSVVLNDANQVAFAGSLRGPGVGSHNNEGIWRGTPGDLALAARKGDIAPGAGQALYDGFVPPALNSTGAVAFRAVLVGSGVADFNNDAIWTGAPEALGLVARENSANAGLPNGVLFGAMGAPVLNNRGQLAFKSMLQGAVASFNNEALWAGNPGDLQLVARKGSRAQGLPSQVNYDGFVTDPPGYNDSNQVAFVAPLTGLGVGTFNNQGIWAGEPAALTLVARKGNTAPGLPTGINYDGFERPVINSSGHIAFRGLLTGQGVGTQNNQAIWAGLPGALSLIARSGSNAPGTSTEVLFSGFSDPVINEAGMIVFKASLTGLGIGLQNNEGYWVSDTSRNVRLVIRKGGSLDIGGGDLRTIDSLPGELLPGNGQDGRPRSLNGAGQLALHLGLLSGTNALVVAELAPSVRPAVLSIAATTNSSIRLSWTENGVLESATAITGPWTASTIQTNPQVIPIEPSGRFFRLLQP
jgi:hypothetical protein